MELQGLAEWAAARRGKSWEYVQWERWWLANRGTQGGALGRHVEGAWLAARTAVGPDMPAAFWQPDHRWYATWKATSVAP